MNIQSASIQSTNSSNSANRSFGHQRQDGIFQARRSGADRDRGYGGRSISSNPDYLQGRYASSPRSPRFRIS